MTAFPRTLLQLVQQAQLELTLIPSASSIASVIGNTDGTTAAMLAAAQEIGEELRDIPEDGWTSMHVEFDLAVPAAISLTGNTSANLPQITGILPNTTGLAAFSFAVSGSNIPAAARILTVDNANQFTMTMEATGAATATPIAVAQDTFTLPSDFKFYSNRTFWDRTNRWELLGPDSPQMDQWHRSGIVVTGPRRHFRNIGRLQSTNPTWRLWPSPFELSSPIQLAFEYLSTDWIASQAGAITPPSPPVYTSVFANDTDVPVLNDRAMIDGIKWKYCRRKGLLWDDMRSDWMDLVDRLIANDGGSPTLQLAKRVHPIFVSPASVQDGFFRDRSDPILLDHPFGACYVFCTIQVEAGRWQKNHGDRLRRPILVLWSFYRSTLNILTAD